MCKSCINIQGKVKTDCKCDKCGEPIQRMPYTVGKRKMQVGDVLGSNMYDVLLKRVQDIKDEEWKQKWALNKQKALQRA